MLRDCSGGAETFRLVCDEVGPECAAGSVAVNPLLEVTALTTRSKALPGRSTNLTRPLGTRGPSDPKNPNGLGGIKELLP